MKRKDLELAAELSKRRQALMESLQYTIRTPLYYVDIDGIGVRVKTANTGTVDMRMAIAQAIANEFHRQISSLDEQLGELGVEYESEDELPKEVKINV